VLKLSPGEAERHTIFLLLAMALVYDGWGVDRARPDLVAAYATAEPQRRFPDYADTTSAPCWSIAAFKS